MNVLRIARYRLLRSLGSGGAAQVYLAEDTRLRRKVALKIRRDATDGTSFEQEARYVSMLNHPNIITVLDYGCDEGVPYVVTEFVEGTTVREMVRSGPLPVLTALDIAIGIGSALIAAHEQWIVHRDIKPENVMIRPDGAVKVLDFGVARLSSAPTPDPLRAEIVGTLDYLSPEQVRGEPVIEQRSDIFSLGVVLYEMLTGHAPFRGRSVIELLASIVEEEPEPLPAQLPAMLQPIVTRALQKAVHDRYPTAADLVADLYALRLDLLLQQRLDEQTAGRIPVRETPRRAIP